MTTLEPRKLAPWLAALYTGPDSTVWEATLHPEGLEPVFASLWEQQWPRLRRAMSFCSTFLGSPESGWANIVGVPKGFSSRWRRANPERFSNISSVSLETAGEWVNAAAYDAATRGGTPLRDFLWRHGASEERPRELFQRLAEAFVLASQASSGTSTEARLLASLRSAFPERDRMSRLKTELFGPPSVRAGGPNASAPELDLVSLLLSTSDLSHLPEMEVAQRAAAAWTSAKPKGRGGLLAALAKSGSAAEDGVLVDTLAPVLEPSAFAELSMRALPLAVAFLRRRPEAASDEAFWRRPSELAPLVTELVAKGASPFNVAPLISGALRSGAAELFGQLAHAFPKEAGESTSAALARGDLAYWGAPEPARTSLEHHPELVARAIKESKEPSRGLLQAGACLLSPRQVRVPLSSWACILPTLQEAPDNEEMLHAQCFLLAASLSRPSDKPHAERLAGACYGNAYAALASSHLPQRGWQNLETSLPKVRLYREWDRCWRLKEAVASSFIENDWSSKSLPEFATDREAFRRLIRAIANSREGRRLLRDSARAWPASSPAWAHRAVKSTLD